jgi:hypothetical protein
MDNKETETKDEIEAIDIIPKKINITVETNIEGDAPFPLTYDKIYNPVKSSTLPQPKNPNYPYFVSNVKYSEKVLMSYLLKDYGLILLSFFDKKYFSNMIQEFSKEKKPKEGEEYVNHNIFLTLLFLFPMRYPRPANISTSYAKYICKDANVCNDTSVCKDDNNTYTKLTNNFISGKNTTSALLINMRDIETSVREYSYVNTSKGEATVTQIVWLNDVLNNPKYRELIDLLIQYESWVKNKRITIKKDIDTAITDLISSAKNSITDKDIDIIKEQKNTSYSKNDFIEDILKTIDNYIVIENKDSNINIYDSIKKTIDDIKQTTNTDKDNKNEIRKYIDNPTEKSVNIDTLIEHILNVFFNTDSVGEGDRASKPTPVIMDFLDFNEKKNDGNKEPYIKLQYKNNDNTYNEIKLGNIEMEYVDDKKYKLNQYVIKNIKTTNIKSTRVKSNTKKTKTKKQQMIASRSSTPKQINGGATSKTFKTFIDIETPQYRTEDLKREITKLHTNDINTPIIISLEINDTEGIQYYLIVDDFLYLFKDELIKLNEYKIFKENLKNDIDKLVIKYNKNAVKSQIDPRVAATYLDIDIRIKKAVEELNLLNQALQSGSNNNENFKKIVNAVDSLKTFFTDQSIKENRLTEVSTIKQNFEKILKKTNIIKTLKYIEENIINSPGINLNYKSESSEFNTVLNSELEKEKYSYFMNTVTTINKDFLNIQSTNQKLENIIKDYFNNRNNDLIKILIVPAKKAINENTLNDCKDHYMETGVSITTSSAKKLYEYEINVYMEVVIGKVDYQTQNNIKCDYKDEKLVAYFNRDSMNANKFEIVKSKAINLNKQPIQNNQNKQPIQNNQNKEPIQNNQKKEPIQNNQNKQPIQNNQNKEPIQNNQNNQKKTKGGKSTRKKKYLQYLQNNKRYTSKRR